MRTFNDAQALIPPAPPARTAATAGRGIARAMGQNALLAFPPQAFEEEVVHRRFFGRRQICQIRSMALSRVYNLQTSRSPRGEQFSIRIYGSAQLGDIVSQHFAKSARLEKIALHVDDEERTVRGLEFEFVRFRINAQGPAHLRG